jgi:hypothetical protein
MKAIDKVFWIRAIMGIFTGLALSIMTLSIGFSGSDGFLFAFFMYILSYYIIRSNKSIKIPPKESRKLITTGLGSFILLFLFTWILINTLFST